MYVRWGICRTGSARLPPGSSLRGITSLDQVAHHSEKELLAIHGVGPKAIAVLGEALAAKGLDYGGS
jgi:hypothetical protein